MNKGDMNSTLYTLLPGLDLQVYEDGSVKSSDSFWIHPVHGGRCRKEGRFLKFTDNGSGYRIANISLRSVAGVRDIMGGKFRYARNAPVTQHRLVYAAFNGLNYWDEFAVGHLDENPSNNCLGNLYGIDNCKRRNMDSKKKAYKALELIMRGEIEVPVRYRSLFF